MKAMLTIARTHLSANTLAKAMLGFSLFLTGCAQTTLGINTAPVTHYLVNTDTGAYCRAYADTSAKGQCQSLISLASHILESKVIENIYQQPIEGPNRALSAINLIIRGDNIDYQSQLLDSGLYSVPVNQQTNTVWRTLKKIEHDTYSN